MAIYWVSLACLFVASLLAIFSFSFSSVGAGLTTQERIQLNALAGNITTQQQQSQTLLESVEPLQQAVDNTTDTIQRNKDLDIPTLIQCEEGLGSYFPLLEQRVTLLDALLDELDLTRLDSLGPALDSTEQLVQTLATSFQNTGVVQVIQDGTFLLGNGANETVEFVNMTYSLREMLFPGGARLYFVRIPPSEENLLIDTVGLEEATLVLYAWDPPLLESTGLMQTPAEDAILDAQRGKIQVTPTPVVFDQRRYDLENGKIYLVDTGRNFTQGDVVAVLRTIEMNVGFL